MTSKKETRKIHIYGPFAETLVGFIQDRFPSLEIVPLTNERELREHLDEIEVLLSFRPPKDALAQAPRISWIMTMGAGVDTVLPNPGLRKECIITNARGIHAIQISEYVMGAILALALRLPEHIRNQSGSTWQLRPHTIINGKTMAVLGLGSIGKEIAKKARGLDLRVIGLRKHPTPVENVETVYGPEQLHDVLSQADFVVLIVPLTPHTKGLIGKAELQAMKPSAFLVNAARGEVVVEAELVKALQEGTIAAAALDVFEQEPLPPESPLWKMDNVIITPHNAGMRRDYFEAVSELFSLNLENYLSGKPMFNIVNREEGY